MLRPGLGCFACARLQFEQECACLSLLAALPHSRPSLHTSHPFSPAVIMYAFFISIRHLRTAGKQRGPYIWQVKGASSSHKGSCFCSAVDDYCLCGPSLAVDTIVEYSEKEDGPVTALVFVKRRDGRGMACVGGFVQLGEFESGGEGREGMRWRGRGGAALALAVVCLSVSGQSGALSSFSCNNYLTNLRAR